jgi:hypothetical protein
MPACRVTGTFCRYQTRIPRKISREIFRPASKPVIPGKVSKPEIIFEEGLQVSGRKDLPEDRLEAALKTCLPYCK